MQGKEKRKREKQKREREETGKKSLSGKKKT
jgi:hypothetical protein